MRTNKMNGLKKKSKERANQLLQEIRKEKEDGVYLVREDVERINRALGVAPSQT